MMSYKTQLALVDQTRAGCNININSLLIAVFSTSVETGSVMYSYCVEYLLTEVF